MKRLQVRIDEEMAAALERQAMAENTSKSALVRRYLRERLAPLPDLADDPIMRMAGVGDYESSPVDEVVYR